MKKIAISLIIGFALGIIAAPVLYENIGDETVMVYPEKYKEVGNEVIFTFVNPDKKNHRYQYGTSDPEEIARLMELFDDQSESLLFKIPMDDGIVTRGEIKYLHVTENQDWTSL